MCFAAIAAAASSAVSSIGAWLGSTSLAAGSAAAASTAAAAGTAAAGTAAATGAALTNSQILSMGMSAASGISSFIGAQNQASAAEQVARNNRIMAERAATDAQRRGEEDVQKIQRQAAGLRGAQRSMMAARGLDLASGTPAEILDQTDFFAEQDAATARMNARREAWAIRADAANQSYAAREEASRMRMSGAGSLLGSAMSVADRWTTYRRPAPRGVV